MLVAYVSLGVAIFTLVLAIFIHSETRDMLRHIKAITYTLPGAYDVDRLIRDIEKTGELRGKVVCDEPKNTHIHYTMPCPQVPRGKWIPNRIWRFVGSLASVFSGNIDVAIERTPKGRWEISSGCITSLEVGKFLEEGWEPFSVTSDNKVWLRKEVLKEEKVNS